jgi:hypothetical protein
MMPVLPPLNYRTSFSLEELPLDYCHSNTGAQESSKSGRAETLNWNIERLNIV